MKHALAIVIALLPLAAAAQHASPYSGQEQRGIKALPPEQVQGLLAGSGLGYAKAAELNSWPGPRHVLDAAAELRLNPDQHARIEAIFGRMQQQAQALGHDLVAREATLDRLFASREVDAAKLAALTGEIGALDGRLRAVHLQAHLETAALLTPQQIAAYDRLRGYGSGGGGHRGHH